MNSSSVCYFPFWVRIFPTFVVFYRESGPNSGTEWSAGTTINSQFLSLQLRAEVADFTTKNFLMLKRVCPGQTHTYLARGTVVWTREEKQHFSFVVFVTHSLKSQCFSALLSSFPMENMYFVLAKFLIKISLVFTVVLAWEKKKKSNQVKKQSRRQDLLIFLVPWNHTVVQTCQSKVSASFQNVI